MNPFLVFALLSTLISVFTSLIIFYFSFKREARVLHKMVLRQWALAFLLFSWFRIPVVMAAAGMTIIVPNLNPLYAGTSFLFFIALFLFWRGASSFFTIRKLWLTVVPAIFCGIFWILTLFAFFVLRTGFVAISLMISVEFFFVVLMVIGGTLRYIKQLDHALTAPLAKFGAIIFILGWIIYSISNYYILWTLGRYPHELWFIALVSNAWIYFGFALAHLQMTVGLYLAGFHRDILPVPGMIDYRPKKTIN